MKTTTTIIFLLILMSSCQKNKPKPIDVAKTNIEAELMQALNDPESYEFVSISPLDTVYAKDYYKEMMNNYTELLNSMSGYPEKIESFRNRADEFNKYGYPEDAKESEDMADELQASFDKAKQSKSKFEKSYNDSNDIEIKEIKTIFTCRAKNRMGAKVLADYSVVLTDSLTVKDISQNGI